MKSQTWRGLDLTARVTQPFYPNPGEEKKKKKGVNGRRGGGICYYVSLAAYTSAADVTGGRAWLIPTSRLTANIYDACFFLWRVFDGTGNFSGLLLTRSN